MNNIYCFPYFFASLLDYGAIIQATRMSKSYNAMMVKRWIQLSCGISCFLLYRQEYANSNYFFCNIKKYDLLTLSVMENSIGVC